MKINRYFYIKKQNDIILFIPKNQNMITGTGQNKNESV